jgi:drug/metabolite transporter (DMT)-like permease
MDDRRPDRATLAAFAGVVLMGGSNIVAVRFSNRDLAPFWGAALRFAAASAVMFGIVWARRLPLPRGRSLRLAMLYGVLSFTTSYAFFYWGAVRCRPGWAGSSWPSCRS